MSKQKLYPIVLIGACTVGKTSICSRFIDGNFRCVTTETFGVDFGCKDVSVDGEIVRLQIFDPSGHERHRTLVLPYLNNANAVVLVVSRGMNNSLSYLEFFFKEFFDKRPGFPIILVKNKVDFDNQGITDEKIREFAVRHNVELVETSAKTGFNIDYIFTKLAYRIKGKNYNNTDSFEYKISQRLSYIANESSQANEEKKKPKKSINFDQKIAIINKESSTYTRIAINAITGGMTEESCTITFNGKFPIETSLYVACSFSRAILKMLLRDSTLSNFDFSVAFKGSKEEISNFIEKVKVSINTCEEFHVTNRIEAYNIAKLGKALGLQQVDSLYKDLIDDLCVENVVYIIEEKQELTNDNNYDEEINFIAENFELVSQEESFVSFSRKECNIDIIERIIRSENLTMNSEDTLLDFLITISECRSNYLYLFEYVFLEYCSTALCLKLASFVQNMFQDHPIISLMNCFARRLDKHVIINPVRIEKRHTSYDKEYTYTQKLGIIHSLGMANNGNPADKKLVGISANCFTRENHDSYQGDLKYLFDYEDRRGFYDDHYFASLVTFDFKDKKASVNKYTIQFGCNVSKNVQKWVIEGSDDMKEWKLIDNRYSETKKHEDFETEVYLSQNDPSTKFKYIRLLVTEPWANNSRLALTSIDFYGEYN